ncbi:MAG: hypothetical protein LBU25_02135 [Treponema sp.]|jgi:hypothetical protein|nr:hypothetical protein [Treponema sp.]
MKKKTLRAVVISAALGLLVLAGCDTATNPETSVFTDTGRTYRFNTDGSYEVYHGEYPIDNGAYLVKDNRLFLLREYPYTNPIAVAAAVAGYTFTQDETGHRIFLSSALGTSVYSLEHTVPVSRTLTDSLNGKKWKSGLNANGMWNVWDFKNDGTFQYVHYHTETDTKDVGDFSYLVNGGFLVTVAPSPSNTETGPTVPAYQVDAYGIKDGGLSFSLSSAASGGSAVYTLEHDDAKTHTESSYEFAADGTYQFNNNDAGTYIVRNNTLVLLPTGSYASAGNALEAAKKYAFTVTGSQIALISGSETNVYTLTGAIPPAITPPERDKLAGKTWKAGTGTSMWNWYGFRNNGTYHYYHHMSGRPDYIDRGDFSYLLQGDILITLSAFDSDTKSPGLPPYTVAAYKTSNYSDNEADTITLTPSTGNAQSLTEIPEGYTGFPPEHYDDGFGGGNNAGGDHGGDHGEHGM